MKTILLMIFISFGALSARAQQGKTPVMVTDAPTLYNTSYNPYYDYADQGNRMYENNSHFYNKDNTVISIVPTSNGTYIQPGNSNPINQDMYQGVPAPSGTIYSGYIPVRDYGNATQPGGYSR